MPPWATGLDNSLTESASWTEGKCCNGLAARWASTLALTARACDYAVERMRWGEL